MCALVVVGGKRGNFESSDILFGQLMLKIQPVSKFFVLLLTYIIQPTQAGIKPFKKTHSRNAGFKDRLSSGELISTFNKDIPIRDYYIINQDD